MVLANMAVQLTRKDSSIWSQYHDPTSTVEILLNNTHSDVRLPLIIIERSVAILRRGKGGDSFSLLFAVHIQSLWHKVSITLALSNS